MCAIAFLSNWRQWSIPQISLFYLKPLQEYKRVGGKATTTTPLRQKGFGFYSCLFSLEGDKLATKEKETESLASSSA
jgi:hypothetical protein